MTNLIYSFYSPKIQWLNLWIKTTKFFVGNTSSVDPFARISLFEAHFPQHKKSEYSDSVVGVNKKKEGKQSLA